MGRCDKAFYQDHVKTSLSHKITYLYLYLYIHLYIGAVLLYMLSIFLYHP